MRKMSAAELERKEISMSTQEPQAGNRTFVSTYDNVARCNADQVRMAQMGYAVVGAAQGNRAGLIIVTYEYRGEGDPPVLRTKPTYHPALVLIIGVIVTLVAINWPAISAALGLS